MPMQKNRNSLDAKKESRLRSKNTTSNAVAVNMSDPSGKRLFADARPIIAAAHANAVQSVDFNRVMMYWNLAKRIFEEEQHGKDRADYSTCLVRNLAASLDPEYGSGFSYRQQAFSRQSYRAYPIVNALRSQLNRTQYRLLIQIEDLQEREHYKLESVNNCMNKIRIVVYQPNDTRVKSVQGTRFRQWATQVLKEFMLRGYAINQRLNAMEDMLDRRMQKNNLDSSMIAASRSLRLRQRRWGGR